MIVWEHCWLQHLTKKKCWFEATGDLAKTGCAFIHYFPFFSRCWFWSSSGNTLWLFKKRLPFWKWPKASLQETHTYTHKTFSKLYSTKESHSSWHSHFGLHVSEQAYSISSLSARKLLFLETSFCLPTLTLALTMALSTQPGVTYCRYIYI